jgi:hypothetical protein
MDELAFSAGHTPGGGSGVLRPSRRSTTGRLLALLILLWAMVPAQASAQGGGSAGEAAIFLVLPVGAKGVGVARAMTALGGPESVWWNPAGLVDTDGSRIQVTRSDDLSGEGTSLSTLFTGSGPAVLGASYLLLDVGEIPLTVGDGNPVGRVNFRYHTGLVSGATRFGADVALGANFKVIHSRLACRGQCPVGGDVSGTTWAVDLGAQWSSVAGLPLTLGGAVVNWGPRLQIENEAQADPLPTRARIAAAYDVIRHWVDNPDIHARVALELEDRWRDAGSPATYLGTELSAGTNPSIALRAGYAWGAELQVDGAGVGIGVRYDSFDLGISRSLASTELSAGSEPVNITFAFIF